MRQALILSLALAAAPAMADTYGAKSGELSYLLVHPMHKVEGKSVKAEVVAQLEGGTLKVMGRAPVASFDSGNGNRDAHMLEVVDGVTFPVVVVKGVATGVALPPPGSKAKVTLMAEVELKGEKVKHPLELELESLDTGRLVARFEFKESLKAHKIEPPSLLFVAVEDALTIRGNLIMELRP